jgi:polysaccharide biosynthesis transport protein
MLPAENPQTITFPGSEPSGGAGVRAQILFALGFLRRQYLVILTCVVLGLLLGALYLVTTPPSFTASATMMIDTRKAPLFSASLTDVPADAAWIESQIGMLKSENVAFHVVKQLRLAEDPEFTGAEPTPLDKLVLRIGKLLKLSDGPQSSASPQSEAEGVRQAVGAVMGGLDIRRIGPSYLVRVDFRWRNPTQAGRVANAIVDAYAFDQLNAKYEANRRASDWLRERLNTLRQQASTAEREVVEFRAKNNIVAAGGTLMNDQQLTEANKELSAARTRALDLQARLSRIEAVLRANQPGTTWTNETVSDALNNSIITKLRSQYLDLVNREADWAAKYGRNHAAVTSLRKQIQEIRYSIHDELERIAETYKSDYAVAKKRQEELESQMAAAVTQSQDTNQAQITLRSLESAAQSYRKIYDDFLQRHTEAVQQQSFPMMEARLISPAAVSKSGPRTSYVWLAAVFAGGMVGAGLGALREIMSHVFRTSGQVQSALETECLAIVPRLQHHRPKKLLADQRSVDLEEPRRITHHGILRTVVEEPFSPYAEAIRSIKLTMEMNKPAKVIGLTSSLPSEGKSTLAAGVAQMMAQGGSRVILVDCDIRRPSLSRMLAPRASTGFLDVVSRNNPLQDAVWIDPTSKMQFLPIGIRGLPNSAEILASEATQWLFELLRANYDYVIVDLPPLVPLSDVRATSRVIDSYILVIEWGRTKIDDVQHALNDARGVRENIIGAVLNKVDLDTISLYDSHYGNNARYYGEYGHRG